MTGVDRSLIRSLASRGLLDELFPTVSALRLCELRESLAYSSPEEETAFALQGLGSYPILQAGSPSVVSRWLPGVVAGEVVPAFALSEPGAGSDAAALSLRASRVSGGWTLSGEKTWISNAPEADVYSVFARTSDDGARGVTAFAVPGDAPGLSGTPIEMIAPHAIGHLVFADVFVPDSDVLGEVGGGFRVAMGTLDLFRPSVGAFAVGMAQAALDAAVAHADSREAFGGRLRDLQAVAHKLAEMAVQIHVARLAVHDAARAYDAGAPDRSVRAAMAKLYATEMAQRVVDDAIQVHGARALVRGHLLERLYRDVRAPRIYEGASEVQREIVARSLWR